MSIKELKELKELLVFMKHLSMLLRESWEILEPPIVEKIKEVRSDYD